VARELIDAQRQPEGQGVKRRSNPAGPSPQDS